MKKLFKQSKGFTLIELMVVMTILSVLAGIVVPAVTGTTTIGRGAALTSDIVTVQQAVDRFAGENTKGTDKGWPTGNFSGGAGDGSKGELPTAGSVPIDWGANFSDQNNVKKVLLIHYLRGSVTHSGATRDDSGTNEADIRNLLMSPLKSTDITEAKYGKVTDGNVKITLSALGAVGYDASTGSNWPGGGEGDNAAATVGKDIAATVAGTSAAAYPVWRLDQYGKVIVVMGENEY